MCGNACTCKSTYLRVASSWKKRDTCSAHSSGSAVLAFFLAGAASRLLDWILR